LLEGESANNVVNEGVFLVGNELDNSLTGGSNSDVIHGGAGNDVLNGGDGNDTLWGGSGNDTLAGGYGDDVYMFGLGDGHDVINETENRAGRRNLIRLGTGIGENDIELLYKKSGTSTTYSDLTIRLKSTGETLTIKNGLSASYANAGNSYSIQAIEFADGTMWEWEDILGRPKTLLEGEASGNAVNEGAFLSGNELDNTIVGGANNDILHGGSGDDALTGGTGDDVLTGGIGNDILTGGAGDDIYWFGLGDGHDVINETGGADRLLFGDDLAATDLWFSRSGNHLVVEVLGGEDRVTINNWYAHDNYRVESISAGDRDLASGQMDLLIQALAAFGVPEGTDGRWTEEQRESLAPILAAYWQSRSA
jgi:Ca2+-binding RTX toxin-like protein